MKPVIGVIGGGNMGSAIISGVYKHFPVRVCELDPRRVRDLKRRFRITVGDFKSVVDQSHVILLAVKPQGFEELLEQLRPLVGRDKLLISIAAGITCSYIEKRLGKGIRVIRTMPNLPAQVGMGMTGVCQGKSATLTDLTLACEIFNHIGKTVVVEEKWMDTITAVSGSGPAYVFLFVECFENAARRLGLKEEMVKLLVTQTLKGSLALLESQKDEAYVLRTRVTSKGGTTQAAMDVFLKNKIERIFEHALKAARDRARELSR